jgi:Flp pilus assembly protein TadB
MIGHDLFLQVGLLALGGAVFLTCVMHIFLGRRTRRRVRVLATQSSVIPDCETCVSDRARVAVTDFKVQVPGLTEKVSPEEKLRVQLFRAGLFSVESHRYYRLLRTALPLGLALVSSLTLLFLSPSLSLLVISLSVCIGLQVPRSYLRRRAEQRDEEILFYLPLVIEQLVLGVSSSLDVGPCMKWIVEIADERDSHNAVTELIAIAQRYMRLGVSVEESLSEVARLSGHTELKHVFTSLAYVVKHGGEVTKQLQELANAVASQREVKIEGIIKTLEVKATGPVGVIFASFMGLFLTSLGLQALHALK